MAEKESFFKGVRSEMEKTNWPTKEELFKYTIIVVSTVIFFLAFLYALDLGITASKNLLLRWRSEDMSEEVGAKRWYAVHTYSGHENEAEENLEERVESMNVTEQIFRVIIPEEEETQIEDGKAKATVRKIFPRYILVELITTDESWYVIRDTPGVTDFIGSIGVRSKPNPLSPEEAHFILKQIGLKERTIDVELEAGKQVRIESGPFANQVGEVRETEIDKFKLTVLVNMFDRETPVEVKFDQVEEL